MKHLLSLFEITPEQTSEIIAISSQLKAQWKQGTLNRSLPEKVLLQIYEKPSLRTRVSFEAAMIHLGGSGIFMTEKEVGLHGRESLADVARVTSRFADAVVLRTFSQKLIEDFAAASSCPVINGLTDDFHPCQALTDLLTLQEATGSLQGRTIVYLGDGNNVAKSLAIACADLGVNFVLSAPEGYQFEQSFIDRVKKRIPTASLITESDPIAAVKNADAVYSDVWASMGQEAETEKRKKIFAPYQINTQLLSHAPKEVKFMHCLPAKRGLEVTDEIMDGNHSIVFDQAENRMHIARGVFEWLMA